MATLFISPFIYNFFIKKRDLFAPQTFFSLFQFGFHMPWLFFAYSENKFVEHSVLQTLQMTFNEAIPWYAFVHCVFFCMVYLGCMMKIPPIGKFFIPNNPRSYVTNLQSILFIGLVCAVSIAPKPPATQ